VLVESYRWPNKHSSRQPQPQPVVEVVVLVRVIEMIVQDYSKRCYYRLEQHR